MLIDLVSVVAQRVLSSEEIDLVATALVDASVADEEKAIFLRGWAQRGETPSELAACAEAFLPHAVDPGVRGTWQDRPLLDCCGTGGGGLNLINNSTGLMFVLAAMGIPVVKHGNRGMTKKSGSADVLEALGIKIDSPPARVTNCLDEVGCAFLFAPAYHPAFAAVAGARRILGAQGQRSIFNLLGPLLNPARPDARLVGVFQQKHVALYSEALQTMGCPRFAVACGMDAESARMIGEVSANGMTHLRGTIYDACGDIDWRQSEPVSLESLLVAGAAESAGRLIAILRGEERGYARETLLVNAAMAACIYGLDSSLQKGLSRSQEQIDSGRAYACLQRWQRFSAA